MSIVTQSDVKQMRNTAVMQEQSDNITAEAEKHLSSLRFWDKLTAEEKAYTLDSTFIRDYPKGSHIHSSETECIGMTMLLSGEIRMSVISEEGREITLYRLNSGDICMLTASCVISQITFDTHMTAQTDCRLLIIAPHTFKRLTDSNIYARCFMFELMTERFSTVMWTMQQILFLGYDRRLASFLLDEYDRTHSATIRMTHEQIALFTSSAREVVARMLKRFADEGLVEYRRGVLKLTDIEGLRLMK